MHAPVLKGPGNREECNSVRIVSEFTEILYASCIWFESWRADDVVKYEFLLFGHDSLCKRTESMRTEDKSRIVRKSKR